MLKFTQDHEWIRLEADGSATVGISHYAQEQLGDVVYVELPAVGKALAKGDNAAVVESVKAASEVYAPAGGTVSADNERLAGEPALINSSPMADGWFFKLALADQGELAPLMDEAAYAKYCEGLH
ncbi:MAG: glycine cleavage system protein GcvH [Alphaproteobacteria bacterium]